MTLADIASQQGLIAILTVLAVTGTIYTLAMPLLDRDDLKNRMKAVATEREQIRQRERARLAAEKEQTRVSLQNKPKDGLRDFVEKYNLRNLLADETTANKLRQAGYRGQGPLYTYLFMRLVMPLVLAAVAALYLFFVLAGTFPATQNWLIVFGITILGFFSPNIFISNKITNRQIGLRRAWPDAMDLMLICVESGISIEGAFKKVAEEIGVQSPALAEELSLTNAELSFLDDRTTAYMNFATRTGLSQIKDTVTALIQSERYGTPVGQALRVLADEGRLQRMQEAEKKAAALPPKLTVPMIVFFLPVLLAVILGPAMMQVAENM
ncbi:type II secretion system F family protein [Polycladidibacter hongkongensis]|uniref:type II secretion system F family protein n=1 Tax=Polycladidibacter hongkongensis TaxID=1647556 RepID=UPI00082F4DEC|nr:type II secretion system F family protein [Pseudovibrio hongkongensis]